MATFDFAAKGAARRLICLYVDTLRNEQIFVVTEAFCELVFVVTEDVCEGATVRSNCASGGPSKLYKRIRAFLRDREALDLFFDKALGPPLTGEKHEKRLLRMNVCILRALLKVKEFSKLLKEAEVLRRIQPLLLHVSGWLDAERFTGLDNLERYILAMALDALAEYLQADAENGFALAASGMLAPLRSHLPWKRGMPVLDLQGAKEVTWTLKTVVIIISGSIAKEWSQVAAVTS
ncbi:hypothetical protein KFL_000160530 [Klebsormidium nitens]|uniref:Uncharacterized protein n=1 Tax=Klebsormidium nitens TaxID=105231 RepID=A0A1Y1HNU2_KLENI|nr:hypothetical protein KFL_000160530 [Klebsormidium nitens]|eukprot:GAQ78651.1 hypothetical protein KFL_000160530 [Klebsormidium nitens]